MNHSDLIRSRIAEINHEAEETRLSVEPVVRAVVLAIVLGIVGAVLLAHGLAGAL